jgi:hypothetical protein
LNRSSAASADRHQSYVQPFREQFVATARAPLLALTGAAIAVLLIACTNLAAFYVSAFEARRAEFAVRVAIGAGATRLIRQLALEAWLVSSAARPAASQSHESRWRICPAGCHRLYRF